ncbi:MAG: Flp pilus assembly protein CpaB [Castellaniella sp.]|uniref:Flp pilus assembly protein CpaB n=1 Tax=Castellaniella sp. TaxID=1955812 RepID=UPI001229567D|nr:Flp pilus assembly protein CpaB [Castellaniella sp.]TAN30722.1 MAG: Flp pilus assembly protein CpaB [Castellaniella sp.]
MRALSFRMPRSAVLAGLAVSAGVLAAGALALHLQARERELAAQAQVPMVERIVAARDLPAGTRLISDHLAVRSFPARWVGSDTLPVVRHGELEGLVLTTSLRAGDAVLPVHALRPQSAFSTQLAPGRRAITLPVDQVNSLSGLLQPGDLIDLYVSFDHQRKRLTAPLLQGMLVLATGRETRMAESDGQGYSTVTLDAGPEDVVKLVAARQGGTLTAILRHPDDAQPDRRAMRGDLAALLGLSTPAPPVNRRPVILYGASGARSVPSTAGQPGAVRLPSGWFDLPGVTAGVLSAVPAPDTPILVPDLDASAPSPTFFGGAE